MISAKRVAKVLEGMYMLDIHETDPKGFANAVYTFCHIARGRCENPHKDWQKDFLETERDVLQALESPNARKMREQGKAPPFPLWRRIVSAPLRWTVFLCHMILCLTLGESYEYYDARPWGKRL